MLQTVTQNSWCSHWSHNTSVLFSQKMVVVPVLTKYCDTWVSIFFLSTTSCWGANVKTNPAKLTFDPSGRDSTGALLGNIFCHSGFTDLRWTFVVKICCWTDANNANAWLHVILKLVSDGWGGASASATENAALREQVRFHFSTLTFFFCEDSYCRDKFCCLSFSDFLLWMFVVFIFSL